jgi:hypothetical protein
MVSDTRSESPLAKKFLMFIEATSVSLYPVTSVPRRFHLSTWPPRSNTMKISLSVSIALSRKPGFFSRSVIGTR